MEDACMGPVELRDTNHCSTWSSHARTMTHAGVCTRKLHICRAPKTIQMFPAAICATKSQDLLRAFDIEQCESCRQSFLASSTGRVMQACSIESRQAYQPSHLAITTRTVCIPSWQQALMHWLHWNVGSTGMWAPLECIDNACSWAHQEARMRRLHFIALSPWILLQLNTFAFQGQHLKSRHGGNSTAAVT